MPRQSFTSDYGPAADHVVWKDHSCVELVGGTTRSCRWVRVALEAPRGRRAWWLAQLGTAM